MIKKTTKQTVIAFCLLAVLIVTPVATTKASDQAVDNKVLATILERISAIVNQLQQAIGREPAVLGAKSVKVQSSDELFTALANATGGEIILLEPGLYTLKLNEQKDKFAVYASPVTITSTNSQSPATIDQLRLNGVHNVTLDNLIFEYQFSINDATWYRPFDISRNSQNIVIKNSTFKGAIAHGTGDSARDGYGAGYGLSIRDVKNVVVQNNKFHSWLRAGVFSSIQGLKVINNEVYEIRSDGFDFVAVSDVLIEGNYFHDFHKSSQSSDHMDMIQFWTSGTDVPITNITIKDNLLLAQEGDWTQSIFMRNEAVDTGQAGSEMFYRNITIENNVIHNAHLHGITLGEADGVKIRNNTILQNKDAGDTGSVNVPSIHMKDVSRNVDITKNIITTDKNNNSGERDGNLYVQQEDLAMPHYYSDYFVNALAQGKVRKNDLTIIPGSLADSKGYGSTLLQADSNIHYIQSESGTGLNLLNWSFSIRGTKVSSVDWKFGDGQSYSGITVNHEYTKAGTYTVIATVRLINGESKQEVKVIDVQSPLVLDVNFNNGTAADASYLSLKSKLNNNPKIRNGVLTFTPSVDKQNVEYSRSSKFINNREYTLAFDVRFDEEKQSGPSIYFSGSYVVQLSPTNLTVQSLGGVTLKTELDNLPIEEWHRVVIVYDGYAQEARAYINGEIVVMQNGVDEIQTGSSAHSFTLGNPFGTSPAQSIDNVVLLKGALSPAQVVAYTTNRIIPIGEGSNRNDELEVLPTQKPEPEPELDLPEVSVEEDLIIKDEDKRTPEPPTPAKKTPAKETRAKKTPAKETRAQKTPAKETRAQKTPAEVESHNQEEDITPPDSRVRTTANLNVRNQPNGRLVGRAPWGSVGTQSDDITPRQTAGHSWVYVTFDTGLKGYVATEFIQPATGTTITNQSYLGLMNQIKVLLEMIQVLQAQLNAMSTR